MSTRGYGTRSSSKAVVGITSRSAFTDLNWLVDLLNAKFTSQISVAKYLPITNTNLYEWKNNIQRCTVGILYHTTRQGRINITDVDGALYQEELTYMNKTLGKGNVLVVLDDMGDVSEEERKRILEFQQSIRVLSSKIILIPKDENQKQKHSYNEMKDFFKVPEGGVRTHDSEYSSRLRMDHSSVPNSSEPMRSSSSSHSADTEKGENKKTGVFSNWSLSSTISSISTAFASTTSSYGSRQPTTPTHPLQIRIFSRSAESNYSWLMDRLKADDRLSSAEIKNVGITNIYQVFHSQLINCQFAILYHTHKQGRINITDVTDSLYNEELKDLSQHLGKENVIVVVDDLRNTSSAEKERLKDSQRSICKLARDLFLFAENEKNTGNLEAIIKIIQGRLQHLQANSVTNKNKDKYIPVKQGEPVYHIDSNENTGETKTNHSFSATSFQHSPIEEDQGMKCNPSAPLSTSVCDQNSSSSHRRSSGKPEPKRRLVDPRGEIDSMDEGLFEENDSEESHNSMTKLLEAVNKKWTGFLQTIGKLRKERDFLKRELEERETRIKMMEEEENIKEKKFVEKEKYNERIMQNRENMLLEKEKSLNKKEIEIDKREVINQEKERFLKQEEMRISEFRAEILQMVNHNSMGNGVQTKEYTSDQKNQEKKELEVQIANLQATVEEQKAIIENQKGEIKSLELIVGMKQSKEC